MFKATGELSVTYINIGQAASCLAGVAHQTPVFTSGTVNDLSGARVYFKCENFQRTGSFKFRGAYYALSQLSDAEKQRGVITYSSGNHAQAIALAGKILGISTVVIMPDDAPLVKLAATRGYGAEVILYDRTTIVREALGHQIAQARGLTVIPPYDHPDIIAGQGTVTKELLEKVGELDILLVCCGGGGLLSGAAITARTLAPKCQVIGVEPEAGDDATRSFKSGILQTVENPQTIADGARTPFLGQLTWPIVREYVDDMITVSEDDIKKAMFFLWERLKLVVEPTGALATAALLQGKVNTVDRAIGVIISGGNVDLSLAAKIFSNSPRLLG